MILHFNQTLIKIFLVYFFTSYIENSYSISTEPLTTLQKKNKYSPNYRSTFTNFVTRRGGSENNCAKRLCRCSRAWPAILSNRKKITRDRKNKTTRPLSARAHAETLLRRGPSLAETRRLRYTCKCTRPRHLIRNGARKSRSSALVWRRKCNYAAEYRSDSVSLALARGRYLTRRRRRDCCRGNFVDEGGVL